MIIETRGLSKSFGSLKAVDGISFCVREGEFFAFLGPNGAGKTTTINMLCTLMPIDEGEASVAGHNVRKEPGEVRKQIGIVFQESMLDGLLSARENLVTRASFYGMDAKSADKRLGQIAEWTGTGEFLDRRYEVLSGGQKRRVDIARALMHEPRLLILDEPTAGLDPQTRHLIWEALGRLRAETGMSVFLTTHYMEEAAQADRVAVIDKGKLIALNTPDALRALYSPRRISIRTEQPQAVTDYLTGLGIKSDERGGTVTFSTKTPLEALDILQGSRENIADFEVVNGNMDDVFLALTGYSIRE